MDKKKFGKKKFRPIKQFGGGKNLDQKKKKFGPKKKKKRKLDPNKFGPKKKLGEGGGWGRGYGGVCGGGYGMGGGAGWGGLGYRAGHQLPGGYRAGRVWGRGGGVLGQGVWDGGYGAGHQLPGVVWGGAGVRGGWGYGRVGVWGGAESTGRVPTSWGGREGGGVWDHIVGRFCNALWDRFFIDRNVYSIVVKIVREIPDRYWNPHCGKQLIFHLRSSRALILINVRL